MVTENSYENLYQDIGRFCIELAGNRYSKILLYSEISENVISASLFIDRGLNTIKFIFCSDVIESVLYRLWENNTKGLHGAKWRCISYAIENGKFDASFIYEEAVDFEESLIERRGKEIQKHFPGKFVDYSDPDNEKR